MFVKKRFQNHTILEITANCGRDTNPFIENTFPTVRHS